ncbi:hypothetical protein FQZ97_777580 [compost metagenome]
MLVPLEGADQRHGAADHIQQAGDHPAVEDALDEVADQFVFHRQVHDHLVAAHLAELNAQHAVEGDAFEEAAHSIFQFGCENEWVDVGHAAPWPDS